MNINLCLVAGHRGSGYEHLVAAFAANKAVDLVAATRQPLQPNPIHDVYLSMLRQDQIPLRPTIIDHHADYINHLDKLNKDRRCIIVYRSPHDALSCLDDSVVPFMLHFNLAMVAAANACARHPGYLLVRREHLNAHWLRLACTHFSIPYDHGMKQVLTPSTVKRAISRDEMRLIESNLDSRLKWMIDDRLYTPIQMRANPHRPQPVDAD